jgi:hypothetical protein
VLKPAEPTGTDADDNHSTRQRISRPGAKHHVRLEPLIFTQRCILNSMSRSPYVSQPPLPSCLLPHRITLSARASTFGGIVTPICVAVFRLINSSNRIGCSTGSSAGFVPFRILST